MAPEKPIVRIRHKDYAQMLQYIDGNLPSEACGLLAGLEGISKKVYPITNTLNSPVRFLMDSQEQLLALVDIERQGWELLAIYHSHPNGPAQPSETDIREYYYPDTPCLIWSKAEGGWICRVFSIGNQKAFPGIIQIIE